MPVIDASVYVALIKADENDHSACWSWFERTKTEGESIIAPVILLAEVAAALSRGMDDKPLALRVIKELKRSSLIDLVPVSEKLAEQAANSVANYRLRGCDSIYIALAKQHNDVLVTLDKQQLARAAVAISVKKPGDD